VELYLGTMERVEELSGRYVMKSTTRNIRRYQRRCFDRTHLIITEGPKLTDRVKQASKHLPSWDVRLGLFEGPFGCGIGMAVANCCTALERYPLRVDGFRNL
jgi:hypothetical protein